jgi:PAS domain S-box-containing protein
MPESFRRNQIIFIEYGVNTHKGRHISKITKMFAFWRYFGRILTSRMKIHEQRLEATPVSDKKLLTELKELRARLREAEETLDAIRSGAVDAIVVSGKTGEQVYTLEGADQSYRFLIESINEGTVTMSADGTILYSNRQFAEMLGYPLEKIIGSSFTKFVFRDDRVLFQVALQNPGTKAPRFQVLLNSYDMGKIPAQITLSQACGPDPGVWTAVITDLSEHLRYREIVREEKLSRSIMENSPDGIAVCDMSGRIIRASRELEKFCGPYALLAPFDDFFRIEILTQDCPAGNFSVKDILEGNSISHVEARLYCSDGNLYDLNLNAVPLRNEDQIISGCLITLTDITERKKFESALAESERRFRMALKNSPISVAMQDRNLVYLWAYNSKMSRSDEMIGKKDSDLFSKEDTAWMVAEKRKVLASGKEMHTQRWLASNGRRLFLDLYYEPVRDAAGVVTGIGIAAVDLTERKLVEEALARQSEQLAAANKEMESFAYSVSHDLRAPLRAIEGFSRILLRKIEDKLEDDEKRRFEVIRENTQRMSRLIDDLLEFSRLGRQNMSVAGVNMPDLIEKVWEELITINPGRKMSLKKKDLPSVAADTALMRQVLANLLSNAVKYTRPREEAVIEIGGKTEGAETVYFVRDNGVGFDMNYYEKLFGVFQRLHSQEEFEGDGIGLATVQRIICRHGGRVWAEGKEDAGACFYFSLPARIG